MHLRHFAAILPEDISHSLLAHLAIHAHVKFEVLVHQHRQVSALATCQVRVALCALVEYDVSQVRLNFLHPLHVLFCELDRLLGIVLKLDAVLVGHEVLTAAKSTGNPLISLLLPATGVAINRRAIGVGLASHFDPLGSTDTVDAQFSLAWGVRAGLVGMARCHALVPAGRFDLAASLAAPICHKLFLACKALAGLMTDLRAFMTAWQLFFANLTTILRLFMAENVRHQLLATVAETCHVLEAWRAISSVTFHGALVSTSLLLETRTFARWRRYTTLDRRVELRNTTRAEERLRRDVFTRRAETDVAELRTFV